MTNINRGDPFSWTATVRDGSSTLVDPSALNLVVTDPGGDPVIDVNLVDLEHDGTGLYHYDWTVPVDADTGTYTAIWTGTLPDLEQVVGYDSVDVVLPGTVTPVPPPSPEILYGTVERFRRRNLISLTGYSDIQIAGFLRDAAAEINSYCNVPLLPYPGSFRGGSVTDEQHKWRFPDSPTSRGQRRVYPKHWPIRSVSALSIQVGYGTVAPLPTDSLVINNAERWVEITALTIANNSGLFGVSGWIVPMGGLTVPIALISYEYGWQFPLLDERLFPTDSTNKVFEAAHGWWVGTVAVKVDGVAADPSDYVVDGEQGTVTFTSAQTGVVRASYTHVLPPEIERANDLVAVMLIEEDRMRKRGMGGLQSLRVNEIAATRLARQRGENPVDLAIRAPDAALLLAGFRYWSMA